MWILSSRSVKVTSNILLALRERRARDRCRVSRAQVVRALSPGCLPWIFPTRETYVFAAQVECSVARSASSIVTTKLQLSSGFGATIGSELLHGGFSMAVCGDCGEQGQGYLG